MSDKNIKTLLAMAMVGALLEGKDPKKFIDDLVKDLKERKDEKPKVELPKTVLTEEEIREIEGDRNSLNQNLREVERMVLERTNALAVRAEVINALTELVGMEDRFRAETGMGMPSSLQAIMDNLSTALGVKDKLLPHEVDMLPNPDADEDGCGNPDCLSCASEKSKGRGDVFPVGNKMGALVMDIPAELSSLHQRALQEYNGAIDVNNLPLKPFSEQLFKAMAGLPDVNPKAKRVIVEILNKNEEAKKA